MCVCVCRSCASNGFTNTPTPRTGGEKIANECINFIHKGARLLLVHTHFMLHMYANELCVGTRVCECVACDPSVLACVLRCICSATIHPPSSTTARQTNGAYKFHSSVTRRTHSATLRTYSQALLGVMLINMNGEHERVPRTRRTQRNNRNAPGKCVCMFVRTCA